MRNRLLGLSNACHHLAAVRLGANKSHLVAAQVNGIVRLSANDEVMVLLNPRHGISY
jgi:hypothetical protein